MTAGLKEFDDPAVLRREPASKGVLATAKLDGPAKQITTVETGPSRGAYTNVAAGLSWLREHAPRDSIVLPIVNNEAG